MPLKAVMYHYVRPDRADLPNFRHLHVDDFRRQLDYFEVNSNFVDRDAFLESFSGGPLPEGVILTFDDGFVDHHDYVLPELKGRGLWGIFYIPTAPLESGKMLSVHRIHMLLGRHPAVDVAERLGELVEEGMIEKEKREEFQEKTYRWQKNPDDVLYVKRTLNYFLESKWRKYILDILMQHFFGNEESDLVREFYMTPQQIRALHDAGMIIGSHTRSHPVMSHLDRVEQEKEIRGSFEFLENLLGPLEPRTFCYPYGGFHSFTKETEDLLKESGCLFSYNVEPRDINEEDILSRPQALPRYDCNMFPHGQCRVRA